MEKGAEVNIELLSVLGSLPLYLLPPPIMDDHAGALAAIAAHYGHPTPPSTIATAWGVWGCSLNEFIAMLMMPLNEQAQ